jgi:hypothetical protein
MLGAFADKMGNDLGLDDIRPSCRPLRRVANPLPMSDQAGKIRAGFEAN